MTAGPTTAGTRPSTKEDGERERKEVAAKRSSKPEAAGGGNFRIPPKSEGAGPPLHPGSAAELSPA